MTTTAAPAATDVQFFSLLFQYTVEAYKTYQKLAENLPNPLSARLFVNFAQDERGVRDLLELKYLEIEERVKITLGADLRFQEILEGDLAPTEIPELLISRERAMEKKLLSAADGSNETDATLYTYIAAVKRAHVAALERERRMLSLHEDWFRREDAASILTSGRAVR
jgi:rubrerythrin